MAENYVLCITGADSKTLVKIRHDGRLEYGPDYQPEEIVRKTMATRR